jgi:hypothetical protein
MLKIKYIAHFLLWENKTDNTCGIQNFRIPLESKTKN